VLSGKISELKSQKCKLNGEPLTQKQFGIASEINVARLNIWVKPHKL